MMTTRGLGRTAAAAALLALDLVGPTNAQDGFGTSEEARAMLGQAVEAMTSDPEAALDGFTSCARAGGCVSGYEPFKDRDLYVFCNTVGPDATLSAHGASPDLVGQPMAGFLDAAGFGFGQAIIDTAEPGAVNTVDYLWPRPGETEPTEKVVYVTQVGEHVCSLGYYRPG